MGTARNTSQRKALTCINQLPFVTQERLRTGLTGLAQALCISIRHRTEGCEAILYARPPPQRQCRRPFYCAPPGVVCISFTARLGASFLCESRPAATARQGRRIACWARPLNITIAARGDDTRPWGKLSGAPPNMTAPSLTQSSLRCNDEGDLETHMTVDYLDWYPYQYHFCAELCCPSRRSLEQHFAQTHPGEHLVLSFCAPHHRGSNGTHAITGWSKLPDDPATPPAPLPAWVTSPREGVSLWNVVQCPFCCPIRPNYELTAYVTYTIVICGIRNVQ